MSGHGEGNAGLWEPIGLAGLHRVARRLHYVSNPQRFHPKGNGAVDAVRINLSAALGHFREAGTSPTPSSFNCHDSCADYRRLQVGALTVKALLRPACRALGSAVVLVALCSTRSVAQQQFNWDDFCTIGSLQFCASVELTLTPDAVGPSPWTGDPISGTTFSIRMRNLQGTLGATPWQMGGLGFFNMQGGPVHFGWFQLPPATLSGTAGFVLNIDPATCAAIEGGPCPTPNFGSTIWQPDSTGPDRKQVYWSGPDFGPTIGSIVGCGSPTLTSLSNSFWTGYGSFQTCGDGWVGVTFTVPGTWVFDDASFMSWGGRSDQGDAQCSLAPGASPTCAQATPEPGTLILLATGLAGVAGVRRRKRSPTRDT